MNQLIARIGDQEAEYKRVFKRKDIGLTIPDNGKTHVRVKHDFELIKGWSRAKGHKTPHPAIVNKEWGLVRRRLGKTNDYVELPEKWQRVIEMFCDWSTEYQLEKGEITGYYTKPTNSGLFAKTTPYSLTEYYVSIVEKSRAWTDSWSPEVGGRDYVTNRNPQNRPYELLMAGCTGDFYEVKPFGAKWIVRALDITKDPPPFDEIIADPALWYWATQISNVPLPNNNQEYQVSYFPQAKRPSEYYGLPFKGVAMPLLSVGGDFMIDKSACVPVENGSEWRPYYP